MKRLLMLCCLFLLPLCALAEGADIQCDVPDDIAAFFAKEAYSKTAITAYKEISGTKSGNYAFAIGIDPVEATLYGFMEKKTGWEYWLITSRALPQGKGTFTLTDHKSWQMQPTGKSRNVNNEEPVLNLQWLSEDQKTQYNAIYSTQGAGGQWRLRYVCQVSRGSLPNFEIRFDSDGLMYLDGGAILGKVYGTVQDNMRYHSYFSLPKSLEEARSKISVAPDMDGKGTLQEQPVTFVGGQKFAVYSGPGKNYYRAANDKAAVSTNDWIQVFGMEDDFIFIQYAIDSEHMRFGYIDKSALPKGAALSFCPFTPVDAEITQAAALTDDPLKSGKALFTLNAGEKVTLLTTLENYAYVEGNNGTPFRGFVPVKNVKKTGPDWQTSITVTYHQDTIITLDLTLKDGELTLRGQVTGTDKAFMPVGYQVYAHQTLLFEEDDTPIILMHEGENTAYFQHCDLYCPLPENTQLITFCPLDQKGMPEYDHCVHFILPGSK